MTIPHLSTALADRYSISREIGAGGMATVFLAHDLKHDRDVALKVLRSELSAVMGTERFPREIRMVASLNHPHILSLYDSGESGGFLYYVMPFVEGETLYQRLKREHQLPISDTMRILSEVTDALSYAHEHGVVHRDIKPANVLLSGRHAVVADFGVAKALSASAGDQLTTVGIAVGTPQYMAPEQAMGEASIDHRVDIYAVGCLAYEMLTGQPPFSGRPPQAILSAHVMEVPPDPREKRADIPGALVELVMKCLAKQPADRWQSAAEVRNQLETLLTTPSGGLTPTATRPHQAISTRAAAPWRRRWLMILAAVLVLAAGGVGAWLAFGGSSSHVERVGVMPVEDISGKDKLFATSLFDALNNALAQLRVGVAPRGEMVSDAATGKSLSEIAGERHLDAVLEATVFRAGNIMRINVQLTDPATTRSLWAASYNPDVSNVLAAQGAVVDSIRNGIADALRKRGAMGGSE